MKTDNKHYSVIFNKKDDYNKYKFKTYGEAFGFAQLWGAWIYYSGVYLYVPKSEVQ